MCCTAHFDAVNCLGVGHQCDRQTDGQNYDSNSVHLTTRAKTADECMHVVGVWTTVC